MRHKRKLIPLGILVALMSLVLPAEAGNPNCTESDGDYIVSLPRNANVGNEMKAAAGKQIETKFSFDSALNGFAATLSAEQVCAFKKRPGVIVERDFEVYASAKPTPPVVTDWSTWGLDRIDEKSLPLDGAFTRQTSGVGVKAFIIDTGIYSAHSQFQKRVGSGFSAIRDGKGTEDCNGHGTHVAGTVGGKDSGVANAVTLIPVRVLNCQGSGNWSGVVAGIDWIIKNKGTNKAVANMSLGGPKIASIDTAVSNLINSGVVVVVAAGNDGLDACNYSPANVPSAITVGASSYNPSAASEGVASYSNTGSCVDIFAPGSAIKSAWIGNINASNTISGTSMASPHVAGIVARYLQSASSSSADNVNSIANLLKSDTNTSSLASTGLKLACLINECSKS